MCLMCLMKENDYLYYTLFSTLLICTTLFFYQSYPIKEVTNNDNGENLAAAHVVVPLQEQEMTLARVDPVAVAMETVEEKIPDEAEFNKDNTIDEGRRFVLQEEQEGIRELAYRGYYADVNKLYRVLITENEVVKPADAVVALGTNTPSPQAVASLEKTESAYAEKGIASWYGSKFQGNLTANGEVYDKNKFTAAHLTLPFNTLVKVTFLHTGKDVVVRINDRGPHISGRIIDLSAAAAEEIGLRPHGLGKVSIEVVTNGS